MSVSAGAGAVYSSPVLRPRGRQEDGDMAPDRRVDDSRERLDDERARKLERVSNPPSASRSRVAWLSDLPCVGRFVWVY